MHFRHLAFATACVAVTFAALAEISPPPPPPPAGWEERVTPGYNPSVEQVVIGDKVTGASARAAWHYWDEGAVDVLLRLLDDEQWRAFRQYILRVLAVSPCPRAEEWVDAMVKDLLQREDLSDAETEDLISLIGHRLWPISHRTEACIALCLASGNDKAKERAIDSVLGMRTPDTIARAAEAIGRVGDAGIRARLSKRLERERGFLRALEPLHGQSGEVEPSVSVYIPERAPEPRPFIKGDPEGATISGHVRDAAGDPLAAHITVYYEGTPYSESYTGIEDGAFILKWLPPGPYILGVLAREHQARLLVSGREFNTGDRDLVIELASGYHDDSAPHWMQLAGFRSEDEALQLPDMARAAKHTAREYQIYVNLAPITKKPYGYPGREQTARIHVTGAAGQPVRQITVQAADQAGEYAISWSHLAFRPAFDSGPESMTSDSGEYTVPNPSLVDAEGCARQLVNASSPLPLELKMTPPARLVIEVRDYHGEPVAGVQANPINWIDEFNHELHWYNPLLSSPSDEQGRIVMEGLSEGLRLYAVALREPPVNNPDSDARPLLTRIIVADLRGGEETVIPVTLPIARGGTIESAMVQWELLHAQVKIERPKLDEEVPALGNHDQQRLGELVSAQLAQMPFVCRWNWEEAVFLSTLAPLLGDHVVDAKSSLQRLLVGISPEPGPDVVSIMWVRSVFEAIMALGGDPDIAYWVDLVGNPDMPVLVRMSGSAALGRIGTEESVGAWLALRDTARGGSTPGDNRTHADLMAEAFQFAAESVLPTRDGGQGMLYFAYVDERRETGWLSRGPLEAEFRRRGDDWTITGIEGPPFSL